MNHAQSRSIAIACAKRVWRVAGAPEELGQLEFPVKRELRKALPELPPVERERLMEVALYGGEGPEDG